MKHIRIAACLFAISSLALTGCSEAEPSPGTKGASTSAPEAAEVNVQQPKETNSETQKPSSGEESTGIDYGEELGTVQISVENSDGYTATIDVTVYDPQLRTSSDEMPAWCVSRYEPYNNTLSIEDATSILFQAVTAKVQLDPHEGFPEPTGWAPRVDVSGSQSKDTDFDDSGECTAYSSSGPNPSSLTDEGYEMAMIDLEVGRATPANPLPTTLENVQFYSESVDVRVLTEDGGTTCTIKPSKEFIFGEDSLDYVNSPNLNNGECKVEITPLAGS